MNFPVYQHHRCRFCDAADSLTEDILVRNDVVVLTWRCSTCGAEWQPSADEQLKPDRRVGPPDRRRVSRGDRRKS
ncbi:MAG TPA: hypothetical protein VL262_14580 [Vicinamibacterales bacterium]|nr:hypothetical protein [Vicinamibacterales bacterium]